ncbi:MAG: TonB family protein [Ferruginibacter sp.]
MKYLFLPFFTFLFTIGVSQDSTFLDKNFKQVNSFELCQYYEVVTKDIVDNNNAVLKGYYKSGQLKSEQKIFYKNKIGQFIGGRIKEWYDNGQLRRNYFYKTTLNLDGEVLTYFKDGKLKRKDLYENGRLKEGHLYSEDGIEVPYSNFIIRAEFPGGNDNLVSFLVKNIKYPKNAKKNKTEGVVQVKFMIEENGNISEANVLKHVDDELDNEALRVVNKMPKWSPYIIDGEAMSTYFMLPVRFETTGD